MMKTICTRCRKAYQQSESYENDNNLPPLCVRCALIWITRDDDVDQEPMPEDVAWAWERSGQITQEELDELAEEARRYPEESSDEKYGRCKSCGSQLDAHEYYYQGNFCCSEAEGLKNQQDLREYEAWKQYWTEEKRLEELDRLYDEAVAEEFQRQIDAEIATDEAQAATDEEYYDSFSVFWHDFVGWNKYNRFVAPILIGWLRFKKRWRH